MKYKCLVFDFFGVICSEVAPFWLARYFEVSEAIQLKATIIDAADRGQLSQDALFSALAELTHLSPARVKEEWLSYAHIDGQVVSLIQSLRSQYKLALLTNSPSQFVRELLDQHKLTALFDSIVVSSENGCAKPDARIYDILLGSVSVVPTESLLVDDNPANIRAAVAAGMDAILFHSCGELKSELATRAVEIGS